MLEKSIHVTMFKSFTIEYNGKTIGYEDIKSKKVIKLLGYLLFYSKRPITSSELIDLIWGYEDVDNPIAALKNLVYRLRVILKSELQIDDFVVTGKGAYSISTDFDVTIDVFDFEELHLQINAEPGNYQLYEDILKIYTGDFLTEIRDDHQSLSKTAYFHSIYIARVLDYANILEADKNYIKVESIIRNAIQLDRLDEDLYEMLIRSLYFQKRYSLAVETYKQTIDLLYRTLGTSPSRGMRDLYEMLKKEIHDEDTDIMDIQNDLLRDERLGAYLCEYGAFKELYNMQARMLERLGVCAHLCLLTVNEPSRYETDKEKNKRVVEKTMQKIQESLVNGLRVGDVVSRFSKNQFVVLLSACNYEDSHYVMNRVLKYIQRSLNNKTITIDLSIKAMGNVDVLEGAK